MDLFELDTLSPARIRAGASAQRAAKLVNKGIPESTVADLMTKRSPNNHTYTEQFVQGLCNLAQDTASNVLITKEQTNELSKDLTDLVPEPI